MVVKTNTLTYILPAQIDNLDYVEASVYKVSSKGFSNMLKYDLLFSIAEYNTRRNGHEYLVLFYEFPYLHKDKKFYKDFLNTDDLIPTVRKSYKTSKEVADFINDKLSSYWINPKVFKLKLRITTDENKVHETIHVKKDLSPNNTLTHSGMISAVRHDYAQHGKLKSNTMKQNKSPIKKSNNLTKSCKRMTGDVTALGKNFNKLI